MKGADAAAGTLCLAVLFAEHEHRPAKAVHQPAGDDAYHAAMPVCSREHEGRVAARHRRGDTNLENRAHHFGFRLLALVVQVVQLLRSEERRVGKEWRSRWSPYHL